MKQFTPKAWKVTQVAPCTPRGVLPQTAAGWRSKDGARRRCRGGMTSGASACGHAAQAGPGPGAGLLCSQLTRSLR